MDLHNFMLEKYYGAAAVDAGRVADEWLAMAEKLRPMVVDVSDRLRRLHAEGKSSAV